MNEEESKTETLRKALTGAIQEALSETGEEVLLNKWVFVGDLPVWDENMDAIDVEALLAPAYRMSQNITDMFTIGVAAEALDYFGSDAEDEDEDE